MFHTIFLYKEGQFMSLFTQCVCVCEVYGLYNMAGQLQIQSWLRSGFFIVEMFGRKDRKTGKSDALIHML